MVFYSSSSIVGLLLHDYAVPFVRFSVSTFDSHVFHEVLEAWRRHSNGLCNEPILVTDENVREIIPDIPEDPLRRVFESWGFKGPLGKLGKAPGIRAPKLILIDS